MQHWTQQWVLISSVRAQTRPSTILSFFLKLLHTITLYYRALLGAEEGVGGVGGGGGGVRVLALPRAPSARTLYDCVHAPPPPNIHEVGVHLPACTNHCTWSVDS